MLHEYTGAHVTIIDNDDCCVRISRELIRKLGYEDSIDVLHSDGNEISPKDYSVIHMAVQVSPMEQVFCHIKEGCRYWCENTGSLTKKDIKKVLLYRMIVLFLIITVEKQSIIGGISIVRHYL